MASGKVPLFKAVSCRWYCAQAFQSPLKYFSNVLCYSKPLQTWYVPRVRYGALPLGVNPRIYPLTLWDVNVGFIFHPIFHLKPKPLNLCSQAAVVPHLPAPCLPSGDKVRQADLHTKPCNPVFFFTVPSLSWNLKKPKPLKIRAWQSKSYDSTGWFLVMKIR